jgi:hypothetical protein
MRTQPLSQPADALSQGWQDRMLLHRPLQVDAGGTGAMLSWDSSLILPGYKHGNFWGPVNPRAIFSHRAYFDPDPLDSSHTLLPEEKTCPRSGEGCVFSVTSVVQQQAGSLPLIN